MGTSRTDAERTEIRIVRFADGLILDGRRFEASGLLLRKGAADCVEGGGKAFALLHLRFERRFAEKVGLSVAGAAGEVRDSESYQAHRTARSRRPFAVEQF